jgi:hypothetical protein
MALVGNLKDLKLANIVQLNCMEKNEALFTVEHFNTVGKIYFAEGNIVHALYGQVEGEEAVYKILQIKEGAFKVESGVPPPKRTINNSWSNVLLEGMRLIDEATEAKSDAVGKLAKEMKNINGVNGVLVANLFGEILMEEGIANGKRASAAMAFAMRKIEKLGRASKMGTLKVALASGKSDKKLLSKYHDDVVDVNVDLKASTDVIEQTLEKMKSGS